MVYFPTLSRHAWPHDPAELDQFYGDPRGIGGPNPAWEAANLVNFTYPWHEKGERSYRFHKKALPSLLRVLNAIWDHVGHDQTKITFYHLDETGGTYAYRANRNNPNALSNHSRGIAIDLAPDENPNRAAWVDQAPPHLPRFVIEAFKQEGWRWGGDFSGTRDAMHFEAVFDQHHDQPPVPAPKGPEAPAVPSITLPSTAGTPSILPSLLGQPVGGDDPLLRLFSLGREMGRIEHDVATVVAMLRGQASPPDSPAPALPRLPILDLLPHTVPPQAIPAASIPAPPRDQRNIQKGIIATMFGGAADRNTSAYDNHLITDDEPGCALPFRFKGDRPKVCVRGQNGVTVTAPIVDVGPIYPSSRGPADPYWQTNTRPRAETNGVLSRAGIDLTPKTARDVAIDGKGKVDWWFADQASQGETSMSMPLPSTQPQENAQVAAPLGTVMGSKVNWTGIATMVIPAVVAAAGGKVFGLSSDQLLALIPAITAVTGGLTVLFRTFYTTAIIPHSLPQVTRNQIGIG